VDSPIIVGETLVIGSSTGRILALPLASLTGARYNAAPAKTARRWFSPHIMTRFAAADSNRDGVLTKEEFAASFAHGDFARVDRNGNGLITPLEFGMGFAASDSTAYERNAVRTRSTGKTHAARSVRRRFAVAKSRAGTSAGEVREVVAPRRPERPPLSRASLAMLPYGSGERAE
jgi:hypothetical protein